MKRKPVKNDNHPIRLLSFLWLFVCLTQTAMATSTDNKGTAKQSSSEQKAAISLQQVETIPCLLQSGKLQLNDIPDPHWRKDGCIACHTSATSPGKNNLRHKDVEKTCYNCHSPAFDHRYIHPADVRPDKKMLSGMDKTMRQQLKKSKNTISCTTCHDLTLQCKSDTKNHKLTNPKFFRNGPFASRSQLCFLCHDKDQYQRLNPHDQIDKQGKLRPEKCRVCHADPVERLAHITDTDQLVFNARESLSTMCWGCHPWTPHPGGQFTFFRNQAGPQHLVKPPEKIKRRLDKMSEQNMVAFPLEPGSGKVFCGTCHNVHQKGVIKNPEKAKGAGSKKRLRAEDICEYCHLK